MSVNCCVAEGVAGSFTSVWVARMEAEEGRKKVEKLTKNPVNCVQEKCASYAGELSIVIAGQRI